MLRRRSRVLILTIFVCTVATWTTPAQSQQADTTAPAATQKVEPPAKLDPSKAITTKDPDIPIDELQLEVKPLTLEELQNEAAAWLLLLKGKEKEITAAEIAIKSQNSSINNQQQAASALDDAKQALEAAQKAQKTAAPGSPEYQEATKKVEEAKEKLTQAQAGIKEATKSQKELQQNASLKNVLKKAEKTGELDDAQQALNDAKAKRDKLTGGSPEYVAASKKIDALQQAIKAFEDTQKDQKSMLPGSPQYKQASQKLDALTQNLKAAREAITGASTTDHENNQKTTQQLNEAAKNLGKTTIKPAANTTSTTSPENLNQKGQQLENTATNLQQNAKQESNLKDNLLVTVTNLQASRTAIVDRFNVVLGELDNKGGDSKYYRDYIAAATKIEVDVQDTQDLGVRLVSWLKSDEGGLRWLSNFGKFVGIVVAAVIVSRILSIVVAQTLRVFRTSGLFRNFIIMSINRGGIIVGVLLALTALEVSIGPILALVGGLSFVLAFALQSNLGNFASGLMIMVYKPFDVDDEVKISGIWGFVDSITLASTKVKGFQGQMITIPNNAVWSGTIENLTYTQKRKIAISLRIPFDEDLNRVERLLLDIIKSHPKTLTEPAPEMFVWSVEDYYISVILMGHTKTEDFWPAYSEIVRTIQDRFDKEGIPFARPLQSVSLLPESGNLANLPQAANVLPGSEAEAA